MEKSIELSSFDEMPEFDNFENIPDSININSTGTHIKINENGTNTENLTHMNVPISVQNLDGYDNTDTPRIQKDCPQSSFEPKISEETLSIEISEMESINILNICRNSSSELNRNIQTHKSTGKSKPIIEVMPDSVSDKQPVMDKSPEKVVKIEEENISNEFIANDTFEHDDNDAVGEQIIITKGSSCDENEQINTYDSNSTSIEVNKTFDSMTKSSAITFYCESLDDLKGIESDSDQSLEEI